MKTLQNFSPYNGLHWEPNGSRSKRSSHLSILALMLKSGMCQDLSRYLHIRFILSYLVDKEIWDKIWCETILHCGIYKY